MGADPAAARRGVLLIGPRGAGKSTVGPRLARRLGLPFVDVDDEIERACGRPIAALLADGSFRAREAARLDAVLADDACVAAAGGGAVLWEGLARAARGWTVVWLDAEPALLAARIRADPRGRPSLTGRPAADEIGEVARARAERYAAASSHRIDTSHRTPDEVVDRIEKVLREDHSPERADAD